MISVVIPTLNAEARLANALSALVPATVEGVVRQVVIADGGSTDGTLAIAADAGADVVEGVRGRGAQLRAGAATARGPWLLFLHADTVLDVGWQAGAVRLIEAVDAGETNDCAAAFRFALDDEALAARIVEAGVAVRCALFALPYGDQGLLISRGLYERIGGYRAMPLFEDVDIVRRLGRRRIRMLAARAVTSASRHRRDGYALRVGRNFACLAMYFAGIPPERIVSFYLGRTSSTTAKQTGPQ